MASLFTPTQLECIASVAKSYNMTAEQFVVMAVNKQLNQEPPTQSKASLPVAVQSDCDFVQCAYHPAAIASVVFSADVCNFVSCKLTGRV